MKKRKINVDRILIVVLIIYNIIFTSLYCYNSINNKTNITDNNSNIKSAILDYSVAEIPLEEITSP